MVKLKKKNSKAYLFLNEFWHMKVKHLRIENFRGVSDLNLKFSSTEPVALIGANGIGKTSILDCLAILLSIFVAKIRSIRSSKLVLPEKFFKNSDVSNRSKRTIDELFFEFELKEGIIQADRDLDILIKENYPSGDFFSPPEGIGFTQGGDAFIYLEEYIKDYPDINLPLIIYYSVNRALVGFSLERQNEDSLQMTEPLDAYEKALELGQSNFISFFQWFRIREDLENEGRRDKQTYQDVQLKAVRQSISSVMPEFSDLRVRRLPLRMTVIKQGQEFIINQLSDGEKCLLSMVGDLARRLAIANPGLEDPLQGTGVVLIDEIELHLHPGWQYEIIPALTRTFPNCQFIVTTHSPIVLSQVKPEGIFCLEKKDGKVIAYHPDSSYGRDTNRILEDLMGVPERPQTFKDQLRALFRFIDEGDLDKARALQQHLETEIGLDEPEFARADVLIRRQEILGR
jgi:predicted ATP-binding protein involved in virulence